jgi:sulfur-oxidizing protein SoxY
MEMNRRQVLAWSAGAVLVAGMGLRSDPAAASVEAVEEAMAAFTGGVTPTMGRVTLTTPDVAENGNIVPLSIAVESDMTEDSYVTAIAVYADANPQPGVATFNFTPLSGAASATTRIRLARTQNVIAVAKMSDGSVYMARNQVTVTVGGCGG